MVPLVKWQIPSRAFNAPEQALLCASVGNPDSIEGEFNHSDRRDAEMEERQESGHTTSRKHHLPLKLLGVHIEYVDGNDICSGLLEPFERCRSGDAMSNSKFEVTGILDQTTQSVIVLFLGANIL